MIAWRRPFGVALGVAVVLGSCEVYDDSLLVDGSDASGGGGSPVDPSLWGSGIGWWSEVRPDGCISAGRPRADDRPSETGGSSVEPVYFAVRSMALGSRDRQGQPSSDGWKSLGFDLDGRCTGSESCPAQDPPAISCTTLGTEIPLDGLNCRDNIFGRLEAEVIQGTSVGEQYGLSNEGFNCALCNGDYNFIFRVTEYNGELNDSNIRVDIYPSPGLETELSWQCSASDKTGDWQKNGCWGKDDRWTAQVGTTEAPIESDTEWPNSRLSDPAAYVREGYIVAQLPDNALFWFPGDRAVTRAFPLTLQGGVVAGKLEKRSDGSWHISDGTIAGRSRTTDIVSGFKQLGFCESDPLFGTLNLYSRNFSDIISSGAVNPDADCDAFSVGIGFEADQAALSDKEVDPAPLPGCPGGDGGTDAGNDAASDAAGSDAGSDAAAGDAASDAGAD